jgi:hypothetical protein
MYQIHKPLPSNNTCLFVAFTYPEGESLVEIPKTLDQWLTLENAISAYADVNGRVFGGIFLESGV